MASNLVLLFVLKIIFLESELDVEQALYYFLNSKYSMRKCVLYIDFKSHDFLLAFLPNPVLYIIFLF